MPKKTSPWIEKRIKNEEDFGILLPNIKRLSEDAEDIFTGCTVFIGDHSSVVGGVRRSRGDGTQEIIWTSGDDLLGCLLNLDEAVKLGKWRIDKKRNNQSS